MECFPKTLVIIPAYNETFNITIGIDEIIGWTIIFEPL